MATEKSNRKKNKKEQTIASFRTKSFSPTLSTSQGERRQGVDFKMREDEPAGAPIEELEKKTIAELRKFAAALGLDKKFQELSKNELILEIIKEQSKQAGQVFVEGVLEIMPDGSHGVLRGKKLLPSEGDVYVSLSQIRRFNLRTGDFVIGQARLPKEGEKYLSLLRVVGITGLSLEEALKRPTFESLTPIFPNRQMKLETDQFTISTRIIDLLCPIGFGQRAMIVSPPKAGKTFLLKDIAKGIAENYPDVYLMVVLIGERPEEVTDIERFVKGEVFASNFDEAPENQVKVAELSLEKAKRLVESGRHVAILMDSITRLARAYNVITPASGRTLSGGFDPVAIYPPKRFFGAGRNFEEGSSLTIIATALVETGSKMDEVIYEEFKGTGNMELHLSRRLAEKRIYPAIDIQRSGTRNEELLLPKDVLAQSWRLRRLLDELGEDAVSALIDRMKRTKNNEELLKTIHEAL
jgi:transcription termination factor Rho